MSDPLDDLFTTPPSQFTDTRNALAKTAPEVKTLKKPPVSVWLVNRLWRDERKQLEVLLALAKTLQKAQQDGPQAMLAAKKEQTAMITSLRAAAERVLDETKEKAPAGTLERFETTLRALSSHGSFAPDAPGRLIEDREIIGFDAAFGAPPPAKRVEKPKVDDEAEAAKKREAEEKKRLEAEERAKKAKEHKLELLRRKRAQIMEDLAAVDAEINALQG